MASTATTGSDRIDGTTRSVIVARLDRLPVVGWHFLWITILSASYFLEIYDNFVFPFVAPNLLAEWELGYEQVGLATSAFFFGMLIGALVGGRLSDRFGRKPVIVGATLFYSLTSLASAFADDFWLLTAFRLLTGIGAQAAAGAIIVYIAESFPSRYRGRFFSAISGAIVAAGPVAALVALWILPNSGEGGWRWMFVLGAAGVIVAAVALFALPESVRWLILIGKSQRADQIVSRLERSARRRGPLAEPDPDIVVTDDKPSLRALFANRTALRNIGLVAIGYFGTMLGLYLFNNWYITIWIEGGWPEEKAYGVATLISFISLVAPLITLLVGDRLERKTVIILGSVVVAVALVVLAAVTQDAAIVVAASVQGIFAAVVNAAYTTYTPEVVPTEARGLGSGIILSSARLGGAVSGVLGGVLFAAAGPAALLIVAGVVYIVFPMLLFVFGPRTLRKPLEEIIA